MEGMTEEVKLKKGLNEYITQMIKTKQFRIATEVVVPSLQNMKTDPGIIALQNIRSLRHISTPKKKWSKVSPMLSNTQPATPAQ
mmetsp:Transcript_9489/g.10638  ORF Transcript_9489/g.10638 Transcript_9489/m.10638 type:complete len:84 (+) Transcript_9489:227-478(+)